MATPLLSPGVLIREVDLTVGRADNVLDNIGAIAGPFPIGPVEEAIDITTENELIQVFGKPISTDAQYEYWMSASSFLSYGGVLKVVRCSGTTLNNANAGVGIANTNAVKIKNFDDYNSNWADDIADYVFAAKTPGTWANKLKVCMIDDRADQTLGIYETNLAAAGVVVGYGVTFEVTGETSVGVGTTTPFNGYLKGIITGVRTDSVDGDSTFDVKILASVNPAGVETPITYSPGNQTSSFKVGNNVRFINNSGISTGARLIAQTTTVGVAVTGDTVISVASTSGITNGRFFYSGAVVREIVGVGTTTVTISPSLTTQINSGSSVDIRTSVGDAIPIVSAVDWYDQQTLGLTNSTIFWRSIAPKPQNNVYVTERNGTNDALHVVVIDDTGAVTGIQGNLLEKHTNLSKASDTTAANNAPERIFWKDYIARNSAYLYVGDNPSVGNDTYHNTTPIAAGFSTSYTKVTTSAGQWNQAAQGTIFSSIGNVTYELGGGVDYNANGGMMPSFGDLINGYRKFSNRDEVQVDYLIMGPGYGSDKYFSKAKAQELISIAGQRKDCVAVISPYRGAVVDITAGEGGKSISDTQTDKIIEFFSDLPSSSYAIFDSGYKYTYDRFNNKFVYIPCNPDVAGLCVRTSIFAYPWFSPAGQQRGILNNAIKLAYNPSKAQRDQLYPQRINAIVSQPGIGILLFGDKTALGYASAFDRINVRRLFLTVEQALERSAQAQLFELNDEITRANFINIVEPYLREVQAKRGLYGFLIVCDETNNTPDIIDNNEFRADIYLKPAKSINYVTLTFVATRTGVSFEEVAGRV